MKSANSEKEIETNQLRANIQAQEKMHLKQIEFQKVEMEKLAKEQESTVNDLRNELIQSEQVCILFIPSNQLETSFC
jgi:hypothetical protein